MSLPLKRFSWRDICTSLGGAASPSSMHASFSSLQLSAEKVLGAIDWSSLSISTSDNISSTAAYLKRYIERAGKKDLQMFLRFVTGTSSSAISHVDALIKVKILPQSSRLPQAHTW